MDNTYRAGTGDHDTLATCPKSDAQTAMWPWNVEHHERQLCVHHRCEVDNNLRCRQDFHIRCGSRVNWRLLHGSDIVSSGQFGRDLDRRLDRDVHE
ncbi:hypothetical protein RQP46_006278 [Phenoliferia psychrophenolica]